MFDKDKKIEENIEKCCLHIIRNLETYSEKIRAKEHDKLIEALEKIGHELGSDFIRSKRPIVLPTLIASVTVH